MAKMDVKGISVTVTSLNDMDVEFGLKLSRRFGLNLARQKAAYALSGYV